MSAGWTVLAARRPGTVVVRPRRPGPLADETIPVVATFAFLVLLAAAACGKTAPPRVVPAPPACDTPEVACFQPQASMRHIYGTEPIPLPPVCCGMIWGDDEWQAPTPETALLALTTRYHHPFRTNPEAAAYALLRQAIEPRPEKELDAFADQLLQLLRGDNDAYRDRASLALSVAAITTLEPGNPGTPYARAVDVFIRWYESFEDRTDPMAVRALTHIARVGGMDYIRNVFEASEQPPPCYQPHYGGRVRPGETPPQPLPEEEWCPNVAVWCIAGAWLLEDENGPDPQLHSQLCARLRFDEDDTVTPAASRPSHLPPSLPVLMEA